jgi:Kef-type K+ transport system membrane component KefB
MVLHGGDVGPILALSLLLAAGFAGGALVRLLRLPSVTGYVLGGVAIGPAGLDLIPGSLLESRLQVFTSIALLLIAFGIGERCEIEQLRRSARSLVRVSLGESLGAFLLAGIFVTLAAWSTRVGGPEGGPGLWVAIGLVAAAIAVATAPASTVAVIREAGSSGPLTRLTLSAVVVNNALSITLFGLAAGMAKVLLRSPGGEGWLQIALSPFGTLASLALGLVLGLATDIVVHRLRRRHDVLVVALTSVFLCGGLAVYLGLSPLLAGVAAGFAVVNRDRRDVRAFRALNDFEPPLYAIFFALAGAQLHLPDMVSAGSLGLVFVLARGVGKYIGALLGARSAGLPRTQARLVGLGLLPQAGLAIGLSLLVSQDQALASISRTIISITVASVVINELLGPPLVRLMLQRGGETAGADVRESEVPRGSARRELDVVPWRWSRMKRQSSVHGHVIAALGSHATAAGLTRIAVLLAHHCEARPLAVCVSPRPVRAGDFWREASVEDARERLGLAEREAQHMGAELSTRVVLADTPADGILRVCANHDGRAVVLGHPLARRAPLFGRVVDTVARGAACPVIVVKFTGTLHTERLLVPIIAPEEAAIVEPIVSALAAVGPHETTVLQLLPADDNGDEQRQDGPDGTLEVERLCQGYPQPVSCRSVATTSRVEAILQASLDHDIVVMATGTQSGLRRLFFGSLAEDVAARTQRPMIVVAGEIGPRNGRADGAPE